MSTVKTLTKCKTLCNDLESKIFVDKFSNIKIDFYIQMNIKILRKMNSTKNKQTLEKLKLTKEDAIQKNLKFEFDN